MTIVTKYKLFAIVDRKLLDGVSLGSDGVHEYGRFISALEYVETFASRVEAIQAIERLSEAGLELDHGFTIIETYTPQI